MLLNFGGKTHVLNSGQSLQCQIQQLLNSFKTSIANFIFYANGKVIRSFENLESHTTIRAMVPLLGGKGGYGAKLKTEGGKKVRPNDNMFSRDTQGQRLVHSTMEKEFKEFVKKKIDEDQKVTREREQFKIMENTLKEGQSFMKLDRAYKKQIQQTQKKLCDAIQIGKLKYFQKIKNQQAKEEQKEQKQQFLQKIQENPDQNQKQANQQENKQDIPQGNKKRLLPDEYKQEQVLPTKKIKQDETAKPAIIKFSSAAQRFKTMFKK